MIDLVLSGLGFMFITGIIVWWVRTTNKAQRG